MKNKLNHLYLGDCVDVMTHQIDKESIDLVYADPPYNLSGKSLNLVNNTTGGAFYKMNEYWDTWDSEDYVKFMEQWIQASFDVLKPTGSLYVSCTYHNIGEVIVTAKKLGFNTNNIITWYKTNAMPSLTRRVFTHATEYVCWFVKGKKWVYNYEEMKKLNPLKTKDGSLKQMRDFVTFIELPVVQGKERLRGSNGRAFHPTQKPEKLIKLIITASSNPGDVVLDPFFGTGTTGAVAKKMKRKWIGIEKKADYAKAAGNRISKELCELV